MRHSSVALPWFVIFWIRLLLAFILVGVPALVVGASVLWATRRSRVGGTAVLARRARAGRLAGIAVGAAVGLAAVWNSQLLLAPMAVGAGYLLGILAGELAGGPPPAGPVRVASLQTRGARQYLPRGVVPVALGAGILAMIAPVVLAVLPRVRYGPWHPDPYAPQLVLPGGTLSWPSLALSVPLAVIAGLALLAGGILLRRVALLPQPVTGGQAALPERARRNAGRAVAGAVLGIELLAVGSLAVLAADGLDVPDSVGGAYLGSQILSGGWFRYGPGRPARLVPARMVATGSGRRGRGRRRPSDHGMRTG